MEIRKTEEKDLADILRIYESARAYMAAAGNPRQWGQTNWPPISLVEEDIRIGRNYAVCKNDHIGAVFVFLKGKDIEPTYRQIEDGRWRDDSAYGVIHRFGGDGTIKGVADAVFSWAYAEIPHLRVDTHPDNRVMQRLLERNGFVKCGIIHVEEDNDPRYAYEKTER